MGSTESLANRGYRSARSARPGDWQAFYDYADAFAAARGLRRRGGFPLSHLIERRGRWRDEDRDDGELRNDRLGKRLFLRKGRIPAAVLCHVLDAEVDACVAYGESLGLVAEVLPGWYLTGSTAVVLTPKAPK